MVSFEYLDKRRKDQVLPELFEILYDNMNEIAPSGEGKDEDRRVWLENVSPALDKAPRQIILLKDGGVTVGFFMYYVNQTTFMMEEIQFKKPYQGVGLFRELYSLLAQTVKSDVPFVEAYAHDTNLRSRGILSHLGLELIGSVPDKKISHYRGDCRKMLDRYR